MNIYPRKKTVWFDSDDKSEQQLTAYVNHQFNLYIEVGNPDGDYFETQCITLDLDTAIHMVAELNQLINEMRDGRG